jgi:hypothetical protein
MIYYFGTYLEEFKIESHILSRYGFPSLFLTTDIELAKLYAKYHADKNKKEKGFIYQFEVFRIGETIDYKGSFTYSSHFRNYIFDCKKRNIDSVIIKNTYDCPSEKYSQLIKSDILVVFDFALIKSIKKIGVVNLH